VEIHPLPVLLLFQPGATAKEVQDLKCEEIHCPLDLLLGELVM
jgi:hypothetical protein